MALFGKLFSKEACAICGQEAGMTKKRKVADGIICKDCEAKLSPWFQDRAQSTVTQIASQIEFRERNRLYLERFTVTRRFGDIGAFYFDDGLGMFCALADASTGGLFSSERVTDAAGLQAVNADVFRVADVRSVTVDIKEIRNEIKRSVDGEQVSYSPKHWRYGEDFWVSVEIDHPYVHTIRLSLGSMKVEVEEERLRNSVGRKLAEWLTDDPRLNLERNAAIFDDDSLLSQLMRGGWEMPDYSYGFRCNSRNWKDVQRFGYYLALSEQVRQALLGQ